MTHQKINSTTKHFQFTLAKLYWVIWLNTSIAVDKSRYSLFLMRSMHYFFNSNKNVTYHYMTTSRYNLELIEWTNNMQGAVHKLCHLSTVKRRLRGGRGQKSPILRQHSLWTAPNASISLEITCFIGVNKAYFYVWVNLTNFK